MKNAKTDKRLMQHSNIVELLLLGLLLIIVMVIPFFRGLYFRENYIPAITCIAAFSCMFLVKVYFAKDFTLLSNFIDIGMLGLVLGYGFSFFNGVSPMDSLDAVLKVMAAYFVYIATKYVCNKEKIKNYTYEFIVLYGFIISIVSMVGASGMIPMYEVFGFGNRLIGLYQYPNATASVFAAIYVYTLVRLSSIEDKYRIFLYNIAASTIMLAFLQTKSRGGILILAIAWLLSFILIKNKSKLHIIFYSAITSIPAILLYDMTYSSFLEKKGFAVVYLLLLSMIVAMTAVLSYLKKFIDGINERHVSYSLVGILIFTVVLTGIAFQITEPLVLSNNEMQKSYDLYEVEPENAYTLGITGTSSTNKNASLQMFVNSVDKARTRTELVNKQLTLDEEYNLQVDFNTLKDTQYIVVDIVLDSTEGTAVVEKLQLYGKASGDLLSDVKLKYKYIPEDIAKRVTQINLKTESSSERMNFVKDGLLILKDYPVFGAGGNAWSNLYTKYQSYPYKTKEAHNFYLQTAIESGIVGFVFTGLILFGILYVFIKTYKSQLQERGNIVAAFALILVLLGHAAIDFDLSLYSILLFTWFVIALMSSFNSGRDIFKLKESYKKLAVIILGIASLFILVTSGIIYSGICNGQKGAEIIASDPQKSKIYYEKAIKQDFFNVLYKVDYIQILSYEAKQLNNGIMVNQVYEQYNQMRELDPYKVTMYQPMLGFYLENGYFTEANEVLDKLIELQPQNPTHYEIKAEINLHIFNLFMEQGNIKEAVKYGNAILQISKTCEAVNKRIISPFELTDKTKSIISEIEIRMKNLAQ